MTLLCHKDPTTKSRTSDPVNRSLIFVNTTCPNRRDLRTRKLIKLQVMQERRHRETDAMAARSRLEKSPSTGALKLCKELSRVDSQSSFAKVAPSPFQPSQLLDPFRKWPIEMKPEQHILVHGCKFSLRADDVVYVDSLIPPRSLYNSTAFVRNKEAMLWARAFWDGLADICHDGCGIALLDSSYRSCASRSSHW